MRGKEIIGPDYLSPRRLATIVVVLLAVQVVMCLGRLAVTLLIDPGAAASSAAGDDAASIGAALLGLFAALGGLAYLLTAVFYIVWMRRLFSNLPYLGVAGAKARNWQFFWGWIIPIYSFFKPYQITAELWKANSPDELDPTDWVSEKVSRLVAAWWALYLAMNLSSNWASAVERLYRERGAQIVDAGMLRASFIADDVITIAAAALAIKLVQQLTERQEWKRAAVDAEAAEAEDREEAEEVEVRAAEQEAAIRGEAAEDDGGVVTDGAATEDESAEKNDERDPVDASAAD